MNTPAIYLSPDFWPMVPEISGHNVVVGGDLQRNQILLPPMPILELLFALQIDTKVWFQTILVLHVLEDAHNTVARLCQVGDVAC